MGRRHIAIAAEGVYGLDVKSGDGLTDSTLEGIGQVGTNLRSGFHHRQPLLEELGSSLIVCPTLSGLFSCHIGCVTLGFVFNRLTVHDAAQLLQEDVGRATIEHKMMHIHQQIGLLVGNHYLKTIERSCAEVEGLHEILLMLRQLLLAHLLYGYLYSLLPINGLADAFWAITEVDSQLRMGLDERRDSFGKCCRIRILLELDAIWDIVQRRCGILQAVEIDTCLGVGERDSLPKPLRRKGCLMTLLLRGLGRTIYSPLLGRGLLALQAFFGRAEGEASPYLILNALQRAVLDQ